MLEGVEIKTPLLGDGDGFLESENDKGEVDEVEVDKEDGEIGRFE
jgi:hypothetical protein